MNFRLADTFLESLARLTGDEQKTAKRIILRRGTISDQRFPIYDSLFTVHDSRQSLLGNRQRLTDF